MNGRLTFSQKRKIKKAAAAFFSIAVLAGLFFSAPSIVAYMPDRLGRTITGGKLADNDFDNKNLFAAFGKPFTAVMGVDYDEEPEIPPQPEPEGALYVSASNLCWYGKDDVPALNIVNRTDLKINLNDYLPLAYPVNNKITKNEPMVLIVHTHGTESYLPSGVEYYSADETFRSLDPSLGVVGAGDVLAAELESLGIPVLHDREMYDKNDFNGAYTASRKAVAEALKKYPSIKYVIDLHRDAVFSAKGVNQKPVTEINGKKTAQVMLVVGTNQGGAAHPDWKKNLNVAVKLQAVMNVKYPTFARPVCLRTSSFNQQLSAGSLLLEVGSCGNTVDEAGEAVKLFAKAFAELLDSY